MPRQLRLPCIRRVYPRKFLKNAVDWAARFPLVTIFGFDAGKLLTLVGAAAETIGLPLVLLDYGWHTRAKQIEQAVSRFTRTPFKTLWSRIEGLYSGGVMGDLTPIGALLGAICIAIGVFAGLHARHLGWTVLGCISLGAGAWVGSVFVIVFTLPLPFILLSRLIAPLDRFSNGHPLGLFGVLLAVIGFLVSLFHVFELFFPSVAAFLLL